MYQQPNQPPYPPAQGWRPPPTGRATKVVLGIVAAIGATCVACIALGALLPAPPPEAPPEAPTAGPSPPARAEVQQPPMPTSPAPAAAPPSTVTLTPIVAPAETPPPPAPPPVVAAEPPPAPLAVPAPPPPPSATDLLLRDVESHVAVASPPDVLAYNRQLLADREALRGVADPDRRTRRRELRAAAQSVERRMRGIRSDVRAAAERAALSAVCGDTPPMLSAWDGELVGSERYLAASAHDPGSIDVEHCTNPVLTRACWITTCEVRGRNAFGMRVLNRVRFSVGRENHILASETAR